MTTPNLEQIIAEPDEADIDASLALDGFDASERYPEHGHDALRVAYRSGWSDVVAAIRDSGLTVIATGGADETEPEHLFFAADVIERLHHDVEDADSQTVSAWRLRDRAHTIGCERRPAQAAERNNP
ncbi:hypothetical protein [Gordonia alkanivorans]|uniref:hypothetical protein n=1 Tax=Gordonia alkanivorans TaxID=84096 RepID=UPI0024B66C2A|nr:hypothetical protein [Gordonia alkanivorans]MDJ0010125.1 hypothetical protein [Gordonia alkanivorans]MDJ0495685.1 hypothetical protein [Gordonia alkanivorans]